MSTLRKVEIPIIYRATTGDWLIVCGITYDKNNEIIEVDAWDGDGVVTYEKGEFEVDEPKVPPLYQNITDRSDLNV
ncbi:MAG: hypothetical protein Q8936_06605 [Bacillota bacterium]|nr:hypothetical protein [Bacillota bacterium]